MDLYTWVIHYKLFAKQGQILSQIYSIWSKFILKMYTTVLQMTQIGGQISIYKKYEG